MEGYGYRVQKSVFECEVTTEQRQKMREKVDKRINPEEDSVRYYDLCQTCLSKIQIKGQGQVERDRPFFIV